jgi:addiction module toxin relE
LKFDKNTRKLLYDYISKNLVDTDDPRFHGKALTGILKGLWRYRIMDYRLILGYSR